MASERLAPAKVNLFLHVGPVGADGYHPISSLMAFADVGDVVRIEQSVGMAFAVEGPFAAGLGAGADNLVAHARDAMIETFGDDGSSFRLTLDKRLPIAGGLGGGSADAAAALMLIAERRGLNSEAALWKIAQGLGADVPACLMARPALARGRGDELSDPPVFVDLDIVLANPGVASPTGKVYAAYDEAGAPGGDNAPSYPEPLETAEETASFLAGCRNDLEAPAIALEPRIGEALDCLRREPETLLGRMSGSGATCFAICRDRPAAEALAARLAEGHPAWWVRACRLKGFRP